MESLLLQIKQKTSFQKKTPPPKKICRSQLWEPGVVTRFGNYLYSQMSKFSIASRWLKSSRILAFAKGWIWVFLVLIAGLSYMNLQSGPNLLEVPCIPECELISVNDAGVPLGGMKVLIPLVRQQILESFRLFDGQSYGNTFKNIIHFSQQGEEGPSGWETGPYGGTSGIIFQ